MWKINRISIFIFISFFEQILNVLKNNTIYKKVLVHLEKETLLTQLSTNVKRMMRRNKCKIRHRIVSAFDFDKPAFFYKTETNIIYYSGYKFIYILFSWQLRTYGTKSTFKYIIACARWIVNVFFIYL